jgi:hypothetical protein
MLRVIIGRHPSLIALSVGLFCSFLLLAGGVFFLYLQRDPVSTAKPAAAPSVERARQNVQNSASQIVDSQNPFDYHPILGFWPKANSVCSGIMKDRNGGEYQFRFETDANHCRHSVCEGFERRSKFVLFFGCSFTFGFNVNDSETLPSQVASLAPEYAPYNFGVSGYGPQSMYLQLDNDEIMSNVAQKDGLIVYTFINEHLERAIGSPCASRDLPYVSMRDGRLSFNGTVASNHPHLVKIREKFFGTKLWPVLAKTLFQYDEREALEIEAKLITESKRLAEQRFSSARFCLLIYPGQSKGTLLAPLLEGSGIRILDYSALHVNDCSFWLTDGHPSPGNYAFVARALVRDLNLSSL